MSRDSGSLGRAGLIPSAVSVVATFAVAVLGPSVMEPALPGGAGQRAFGFGFGYLPARGSSMPPGLAWLRPVFRNALTPVALLTTLVILLLLLLRRPRSVEAMEAALSDTRATG